MTYRLLSILLSLLRNFFKLDLSVNSTNWDLEIHYTLSLSFIKIGLSFGINTLFSFAFSIKENSQQKHVYYFKILNKTKIYYLLYLLKSTILIINLVILHKNAEYSNNSILEEFESISNIVQHYEYCSLIRKMLKGVSNYIIHFIIHLVCIMWFYRQ